MSIKSFISSFLLNRLTTKSELVEKNYVFEGKNNSVLLILPSHQQLDITKNKLQQIAKTQFEIVDFLFISDVAGTESGDLLSISDLTYNANFRKKDFKLTIRNKYDIVINFSQNSDPTLELFIIGIDTSLRIRFDRINEKFYNFIVPMENKDIPTRFEQFLKVYQTLKK